MTETEAEARRDGYEDARNRVGALPPEGPGYWFYLQGYMDGEDER